LNKTFSKNYRLLSKEDFDNAKLKSSLYKSKYFLLFHNVNNLNNSRLGLKISKKAGNAVVRNFYKRHIRESFRKSIIKDKNKDIVVVFNQRNKDVSRTSFDITLDLEKAFNYLSNS